MNLPVQPDAVQLENHTRIERCQRLSDLEGKIAKAFYEAWIAIKAIRDERLYLEKGYRTFEEYYKSCWNLKRSQVYRYIDAAVVIEDLLPIGHEVPLPRNESQTRPLMKLGGSSQRQQAWRVSCETAPRGEVTASHVSRVVTQMLQKSEYSTIVSSPLTTESSIETLHTEVEWMLAKLGQKLCGHIWIGRDDHSKCWQSEKLGELSINSLPLLGMGSHAQQIVQYIDVLWLGNDNQIAAAFEVERTTLIYSGLLRMADLMTLCPNLNFDLYVVIPEIRVEEVKKQLSRPTFRRLNLHHRCQWITIEALKKEWDGMMRYATDPIIIIEKLACRLND